MLIFQIEKTETQCSVTWRHSNSSVTSGIVFTIAALMVLLWLSVEFAIADPNFTTWFCVYACLALVLFFFVFGIRKLFGKTRLVLDKTRIESTWTCLFLKLEKRIDLTEIRRFEKVVYHRNNQTYGFRAVCNKKVDFMALLGKPEAHELDELCIRLNVYLKALQAGQQIPDDTTEAEEIEKLFPKPLPIAFGLDSLPQHLEPPQKSRWHYQTGFDGIGLPRQFFYVN